MGRVSEINQTVKSESKAKGFRLVVDCGEEWYWHARAAALARKTTVKDLVIEALRKDIGLPDPKHFRP